MILLLELPSLRSREEKDRKNSPSGGLATKMKVTRCWLVWCLVALAVHQVSSAGDKKKAGKPSAAGGDDDEKVESVIEEVNAKQLERLLDEEDYVAVYWCKLSCPFYNPVGRIASLSVRVSLCRSRSRL